ncbi:MAG: DUF4124 domain-containing protein [Gammaproteobacteria bacterium]|nr:DUF4124 domain-containing protein [Gammaproteobacteria bacterium]
MRLITMLMVTVLVAPAVAEEVYKTTDADGNVIFSDQPSPDAETIQIPETQTVPADQAPPFEYKPPAPGAAYTSLAIVSPANEQAFRPEDEDSGVQVTARVEPRFRGQDSYVLVLDGKEHSSGKSPSFTLTALDRGSHQVSVKIKDPDGKTLISSDPITFHVLKVSALQKKAAPGPGQPPKPPAPPKAP